MEQILLGTNKTSSTVANQHVRDSSKTQQPLTSSALAIQPSSKLEQIEQILLYSNSDNPQPCCPHNNNKKSTGIYNSSGIINLVTMNAAATLNSEGCCQKLIKNFVCFDGGGGGSGGGGSTEPKIYSLQRSISEKLRNSFKNKSNNVNMNNLGHLPKVLPSNEQPIRAPRKWHSERCRTSNLLANPTHSITLSSMKPPVGHKYLTQIPLSSHYKAILAQYTLKPKQQEPQLSVKSRPATFKRNTKLNKEYSRNPIKSQSKKPAPVELTNQVNFFHQLYIFSLIQDNQLNIK